MHGYDFPWEDNKIERTWEVPWDDLADDTDRLMTSVCKLSLIGFNDFTVVFVSPTAVIPNALNRAGEVNILRP